MKKILTLVAALSLVASLAVGGSIAYLQDTDEAVNVMTVGSVYIEQYEQERDAEGSLVDFKQGKPALPAVGDTAWNEEGVNVNGTEYKVFSDDLKNVIDKIVTVKNTGKSDAFVRTIIAIEAPDGDPDNLIHVNVNGTGLTYTPWTLVEINGVDYVISTFTYDEALAPDEISAPSLMQVFLDKATDNEDVAKFGDTWEILVVSQAVQAAGFEDAKTALNEAFGDPTEKAAEWFGDMEAPAAYAVDAASLKSALAKGGNIMLTDDIAIDGKASIEIPEGVTATLNLAGHNITNPVVGAPALVNNGTLTITGDGAVANGVNSTKASHTVVNNGTLTIEGGKIGTDDTAGAAVVNYGTTTINGGTFASKQENTKGDGLCAYAFINQSGTMTINNATLNGQTHGLFGAYGGEIVVNGGSYTMDGNGGLGCYVVYSNGTGVVELNGGTINTNSPRSNRVFFVYDNGNYFNDAALETGCVVVNGAKIYLNGVEQTYADFVVSNNTELANALSDESNPNPVIKLNDGTYNMPAAAKGKTFTLVGSKDAVIEVVPAGQGEANGQLDYSLDGSTVTFNGVTIKTNGQLYAGFARLSGTYNDCVIQNTYNLGTGNSEFNNCVINITSEYLRVGGAYSAVFNGCTFNTDGRAILVFQDGTSVAQTVTVKDCTFNATAAANTWNGIHVAAVSIDGTNGTYVVNLEGNNTVDSDFNGLWQIKAGEANVTVNE